MNINKNGIIGGGVINESLGLSLSSPNLAYQYTPGTGVNSTMVGQRITGFEAYKKYYAEVTITWGGGFEKTNSDGTFGLWLQGIVCKDGTLQWMANPMTETLNKVGSGGTATTITSIFLSATSGTKRISATFTNNTNTSMDLGCRSDYANGKGWVKLSNMIVIPYDKYCAEGVSACKILNNEIIASEIMEI